MQNRSYENEFHLHAHFHANQSKGKGQLGNGPLLKNETQDENQESKIEKSHKFSST